MAITDIISEEFETRAPNIEVAQGGPEDFMSEDEMDPYQDPEFQQLLESLPGEQAEVLMQLIKEFKMAVAQGFRGEFEDFVKMKMASAQGGPEEFMSEEEMIVPDEELQSMVPMGQQVAQGGRIGYQNAGPVGGGIMDVVAEEQVPLPDIDTPQQRIMAWLEARGLPPTPENIQKAIVAMAREGQGPVKGTRFGSHMDIDIPQMEQGSLTGALDPRVVGEDLSPDVARMSIVDEAVIPQEKPYTEDMFSDSVDALLQGMKGAPDSTEYLQTVLEEKKHEFKQNNPDVSDERIDEIIIEKQRDIDYSLRDQRIKNISPPLTLRAQGGRIGYQYGNEVTADTSGVMSQVPEARRRQIEGNQLYEEAMQKIMNKFYEKFPDTDATNMTMEDIIANLQMEGVSSHSGGDILSFAAGMDMITPESVRGSMPGATRRWGEPDYEYEEEHQFDHPVDRMRGRPGFGLGSLVKSVFKGAKKGVKSLTKSIKKFAKSDLGKMALTYLATAGVANIGAGGSWASPFTKGTGWLRPSSVLSNLGESWGNIGKAFKGTSQIQPQAQVKNIIKDAIGMPQNLSLSAAQAANLPATNAGTSLLSGIGTSFKNNPFPWIAGTAAGAGLYTAANPGKDNLDEVMRNYEGEVSDWDTMIANMRAGKGPTTPFSTANIDYPYPNYMNVADGGRIGRAEGGLMDLGGLEKDYRAEGGFVPIGGKEKADDVPARLSRNEFVFTADAVRNAGGGDVDRGSEVMENIMTNLEKGGSISEESQGLEGARDMFEVSERLSEVV